MVRGQKATTTNALVESLVYLADHAGLATAKELRLNCPSVAKIRGTIPSGVKVMKILARRGWVAGKVKTTKKNSEKTVKEPIKRRGSVLYRITAKGIATLAVLRSGDEKKITNLLMGVE